MAVPVRFAIILSEGGALLLLLQLILTSFELLLEDVAELGSVPTFWIIIFELSSSMGWSSLPAEGWVGLEPCRSPHILDKVGLSSSSSISMGPSSRSFSSSPLIESL